MSFFAIPIRANGNKFYYTWFNLLRSAGLAIESFLGAGYIGETSFTIANGNAVAAAVTGLLLDSASYKAAIVFVEIRRKTATNEVVSTGFLKLHYRDLTSAWDTPVVTELGGDDTGVTFTCSAAGQVKYVSSTVSGSTYVGTMKFKLMSFSA